MLNGPETSRPEDSPGFPAGVAQAALRSGSSGPLSTSHLFERPEVDRGAPADHPWERTSAEERYVWWNADWGTGGDW